MSEEKIDFDEWKKRLKGTYKDRRKELRQSRFGDNNRNFEKSAMSYRMEYWSPSESPTWINLRGEFYEYFTVWVNRRPVVCNCHDGKFSLPCVPCFYILENEDNPTEGSNKRPALPFPKNAITVTVKKYFHKVKVDSGRKDSQGKKIEYTRFKECKGKNIHGKSICEYCDDGVERVYGLRRHWSVGKGHRTQLEDSLNDIQGTCGNCKDGRLVTVSYKCPSCGEVHVDLREVGDLSDEEIQIFENEEIDCGSCGVTAKAEAEMKCVHIDEDGEVTEGCGNPKLIDVNNIDLLVATVGENSSTAIVVKDWRFAKKEDELKDYMKKPYDFSKFFRYCDLDEQAKIMGKTNPFTPEMQEYLVTSIKEESQNDEEHASEY